MKRRAFLETAAKASLAAVVTASTWPQFLREAFADEPVAPESPKQPTEAEKATAREAAKRERLAVLSDGYRRAQKAGKPLLVIIIPDDRGQKWQRGEYFGSYINHGTAEQVHPLALCEVVCARMDDLRQLVPTVGLGEPLLVLVETDRVPATVRRLEARMPERGPAPSRIDSVESWEARTRREAEEVDTRIALLAKLVQGAVAANAAMLQQRITQLRAASADALASVESALSSGQNLDATVADRGAALIALRASSADKPRRAELYKMLARAVEQRLRKERVPGSHWARHSGCGTTVEGVEDMGRMVACGMGHVPEKSWRFLYFFSVSKNGRIED